MDESGPLDAAVSVEASSFRWFFELDEEDQVVRSIRFGAAEQHGRFGRLGAEEGCVAPSGWALESAHPGWAIGDPGRASREPIR